MSKSIDWSYIWYKFVKLVLFFAISYFTLTNFYKQEELEKTIKIVIILTLAFMVIDCYYPTIHYE
jgi:hypothetical protein